MSDAADIVTDIHVSFLTEHESSQLGRRLQRVTENPYASFEEFFTQAREEIGFLSHGSRTALADLRAGNGPGALLLRNLPVPDDMPASPQQSFHELDDAPTVGTEGMLAVVADALGEPFSYREWDAGHLVHNKYPIRAHRDVQFGSNAVEFLLHTETPFRDVSPDFLALLCLRGDPKGLAKTLVSDLSRVIDSLDESVLEQLATPSFAFETDKPLVTLPDGRGLTEPQPVISERDGSRLLEFVGDLVAVDASSAAALAEVNARVQAAAVAVALTRGDLLVLDNRRVVHGRNAIEPRYDGNDRWLQRMLVTTRHLGGSSGAGGRLVSDRRYANYPTEYQQVLQGSAAD